MRRRAGALVASGALLLALVLFAHSPTLRAGLLSWEYGALLGEAASPLVGLWNRLSLFGGPPLPGRSALGFRLEAMACFLGAVLALRLVLERLLEPRLGARPARSAAICAAVLLLLHPRAPEAVADVALRPELAAWTLGMWGAALFLAGRQEHRDALTSASLVFLLAAGCASGVAVPLVLVLAAGEFARVRRQRKRSLRLRTATTTAAVFGLAALLPLALLGNSRAATAGVPSGLAALGEELLALVLSPAGGASPWRAVLAGLLLFVALQPAFRAARHAPRLWSGMLLVWSLALLVALAWVAFVGGGELVLLTVLCAGLGVTLSAQASSRRVARIVAVALGFAVLAHVGARPWLVAADTEGRLAEALAPLARASAAPILVLDPPASEGLPRRRELGWLFHPRLLGPDPSSAGGPEKEAFSPRRVREIASASFLARLSSAGSAELRAAHTLVAVDGRTLGRSESGYQAVELGPPPATPPDARSWTRAYAYTPPEPLDPLDWEFARFVADLAATPRQLEQLGWDTVAGEKGVVLGTVAERGARRVAEFDLSATLAWRLAGSVRSLRVEKGVREIERAELAPRLPELAGVGTPIILGADWAFAAPALGGVPGAGGEFALTLLALADDELLELPLERGPAGELRARGAQAFAARERGGDARVAWLLDFRNGSRTLLRARGLAP